MLLFFSLAKQREFFLTLQGCEQCVTVYHLHLSHIFFFFCFPFTFCLSVCLLYSHSGTQNKDSRESLPYHGEEKEVNLLTHASYVTYSLSCCLGGYVYVLQFCNFFPIECIQEISLCVIYGKCSCRYPFKLLLVLIFLGANKITF